MKTENLIKKIGRSSIMGIYFYLNYSLKSIANTKLHGKDFDVREIKIFINHINHADQSERLRIHGLVEELYESP